MFDKDLNRQDTKTPRRKNARGARGKALGVLGALAVFAFVGGPAFAAQNSVQTSTAAPLPGLTLVNDLNAAALNYITLNSGASAPTTSGLGTANTANVFWQDTATGAVKVRNSGDGAWIRLLDLDETNGVATPEQPVAAGGSSVNVGQNEHYGQFVATGAQSFALAQTSTLWNGFAFSIFANAGVAAVSINGADAINGGSAGVGAAVPVGSVGRFVTDGAGNWYMTIEQAASGAGSIASASTTDIGSIPSPYIAITGAVNINGFGSSCQAGQVKIVKFGGSLTLAYNATSMILPGGANIAVAAGDTAVVVCLGAGNALVAAYQPASGAAIAGGSVPAAPALSASVSLSQSAGLSAGTFKAPQLFVSNALSAGAPSTVLYNFSQALNLNATGAGGCDVASCGGTDSFVDVYAGYESGISTATIFGCADSTCAGALVYPGAHVPSGVTQTALIAVVPTDAAGNFAAGQWQGKNWYATGYINIATGVANGSSGVQSISNAVPPEAVAWRGIAGTSNGTNNVFHWLFAADHAGTGDVEYAMAGNNSFPSLVDGSLNFPRDMSGPITTPQTLYYAYSANSGPLGRWDITGYTIK